jgi:hypothetical protein
VIAGVTVPLGMFAPAGAARKRRREGTMEESSGGTCTVTCTVCDAPCGKSGAHSVHAFTCGHQSHE